MVAGSALPFDQLKLIKGNERSHEIFHISSVPFTFGIQPSTYFQINSYMYPILYTKILNYCLQNVTKDEPVTILDICCGSGVIGITLASILPNVRKILGIDNVQSAIEDAVYNAKLNNISYAEYIQGDIRNQVPYITQSISGCCIAVVHPSGNLPQNTISELCSSSNLSSIIFITNNLDSLIKLIPPATKKFRPDLCIGLDTAPNTSQMEVLVCCNRVSEEVNKE